MWTLCCQVKGITTKNIQQPSISCGEKLWKHSLPWMINTMPLPTCKLVIGSAILSSLSCLITMDKMQRKWKNIKQQLRDGSDIPPLRAKCLLRVETVKCFHIERTTQGAQRKASSGTDLQAGGLNSWPFCAYLPKASKHADKTTEVVCMSCCGNTFHFRVDKK